jgi:hypothetical protein
MTIENLVASLGTPTQAHSVDRVRFPGGAAEILGFVANASRYLEHRRDGIDQTQQRFGVLCAAACTESDILVAGIQGPSQSLRADIAFKVQSQLIGRAV